MRKLPRKLPLFGWLGVEEEVAAVGGGVAQVEVDDGRFILGAGRADINREEILAVGCHGVPEPLQPFLLEPFRRLARPMSKDEARLRAEYDLTLRRITLRLRAEKEAKQGRWTIRQIYT